MDWRRLKISSRRSSATSRTSTTRPPSTPIIRQPDGSFLAVGRASLEEVLAVIGPDFDVGDAAEEVDTIGGYIVAVLGRVPVRGELVPGPGVFEIEILDADPRRVKRVRIYPRRQARRGQERVAARQPDRRRKVRPRHERCCRPDRPTPMEDRAIRHPTLPVDGGLIRRRLHDHHDEPPLPFPGSDIEGTPVNWFSLAQPVILSTGAGAGRC